MASRRVAQERAGGTPETAGVSRPACRAQRAGRWAVPPVAGPAPAALPSRVAHRPPAARAGRRSAAPACGSRPSRDARDRPVGCAGGRSTGDAGDGPCRDAGDRCAGDRWSRHGTAGAGPGRPGSWWSARGRTGTPGCPPCGGPDRAGCEGGGTGGQARGPAGRRGSPAPAVPAGRTAAPAARRADPASPTGSADRGAPADPAARGGAARHHPVVVGNAAAAARRGVPVGRGAAGARRRAGPLVRRAAAAGRRAAAGVPGGVRWAAGAAPGRPPAAGALRDQPSQWRGPGGGAARRGVRVCSFGSGGGSRQAFAVARWSVALVAPVRVGLRGARLSWVRTLLVGGRAATWIAVAGRGAAQGGDAGASAGDRPGREVLDADVAGVALARELGLPLPGGFDSPGFARAPPASRVVASHRWHRCGPQACSGPADRLASLAQGDATSSEIVALGGPADRWLPHGPRYAVLVEGG